MAGRPGGGPFNEQEPARRARALAGPALALMVALVAFSRLRDSGSPPDPSAIARSGATASPAARSPSMRIVHSSSPLRLEETDDNRQALDWLEAERDRLGESVVVRVVPGQ